MAMKVKVADAWRQQHLLPTGCVAHSYLISVNVKKAPFSSRVSSEKNSERPDDTIPLFAPEPEVMR